MNVNKFASTKFQPNLVMLSMCAQLSKIASTGIGSLHSFVRSFVDGVHFQYAIRSQLTEL